MAHVLFTGLTAQSFEIVTPLIRHGHTVTIMSTDEAFPTPPAFDIAIVGVGGSGDIPRLSSHRLPWLAWNCVDDRDASLAAYEAGASAVLPSVLTDAALVQAVDSVLGTAAQLEEWRVRSGAGRHRRFHRGETIPLEDGWSFDVEEGVVALVVTHHDGTEGLLGLYGRSQSLLGHAERHYGVRLIAHTDVVGTMHPWHAGGEPDTAERVRAHLIPLTDWAAAQSHPNLEDRIRGILVTLAGQFGRPHRLGTLIDVRITHTQLAAGVGATRSTITCILGKMRRQRELLVLGARGSELFCLPDSPRWRALLTEAGARHTGVAQSTALTRRAPSQPSRRDAGRRGEEAPPAC